jgi:hypothetical protein
MRAIVFALVVVFAANPATLRALQQTVATDVEAKAVREMAGAIPLGSRVKAQTSAGKTINGTLLSVTDDAVIIKKRTRFPEPAITVRFAELARLERQTGAGLSPAKVIGIGLAAGAGAILTLLAFAATIGD